jgi:hypothetical protein
MVPEVEPALNPLLRLAIALIWASLFWGLTILLWMKRPVVRQAIPILLLLYALLELILLLFFAQAPTARRAWLLDTLFYCGTILFVYWALNRSAADAYFEERQATRLRRSRPESHEPEN